MVISSAGAVMREGALRSASAPAKLRLPTRPQNIRKIITIFETIERLRVMPVLIPTVATAEVVSKITSITGS